MMRRFVAHWFGSDGCAKSEALIAFAAGLAVVTIFVMLTGWPAQ